MQKYDSKQLVLRSRPIKMRQSAPSYFLIDMNKQETYTQLTMNKKGKYIYDWPRPMVTVDAAVFSVFENSFKLLFINRKNEPFKGKWALPGGFIGIDEELEDAVVRELKEETGLENVSLEQMQTFGKCDRDPRGRQITIVFMGVINKGLDNIVAGDDAADVRWFEIDNLPNDLAFDHNQVAEFAIKKLKKDKGLDHKR